MGAKQSPAQNVGRDVYWTYGGVRTASADGRRAKRRSGGDKLSGRQVLAMDMGGGK